MEMKNLEMNKIPKGWKFYEKKMYNESGVERRMEQVFSLELNTSRPLGN